MKRLLERIHAIGAHAWLRFLQGLNVAAVALLGAAEVVNASYPGVISSVVGKLPPAIGIPTIFVFGALVHYAARRAKKSAELEASIAKRLGSSGGGNG